MEEQINNQQEQPQEQSAEAKLAPKVSDELSHVASNPKQGLLIIGVAVLAGLYMVYSIFTGDETDKKITVDKVEKPKVISKPTQQIDSSEIGIMPVLPKAPELKDPVAPPPPPEPKPEAPKLPSIPAKIVAPPIAPAITKKQPDSPLPPKIKPVATKDGNPINRLTASFIPKSAVSEQDKRKRLERQKSTIMLISGTEAKSQEQIDQDNSFRKRSDLEYTLSKGKIIDAVTETAINTDFAGEIRALISRDVFSENGKVILIPKGSRVFGTISSGVDTLYGRISIKWERIDLPTGYVLTFDATGVDNLGRKGAQGRLDIKAKEQISNAVLSTALNVAFATALDKLVPPQQTAAQASQTQGEGTGMQTAVQAIYNDQTMSPAIKITQMCNAARGAVSATSSSLQQINSACNTALTSPAATPDATATALFNALMQSANTSLINSAIASTPTKAQKATEEGMTDFSKTVTDIVKTAQPKPTITIDQGTVIKIYVNRDYKFPKTAISKSRLIQ